MRPALQYFVVTVRSFWLQIIWSQKWWSHVIRLLPLRVWWHDIIDVNLWHQNVITPLLRINWSTIDRRPRAKICTFWPKKAKISRVRALKDFKNEILRSPIWSLTLVQISPWFMSHHFSVCHKSCLNAHCVLNHVILTWFACGRAFGVKKIFMRGNGLSRQKSCYLKLQLILLSKISLICLLQDFSEASEMMPFLAILPKMAQYACFKTFSEISLKLVT